MLVATPVGLLIASGVFAAYAGQDFVQARILSKKQARYNKTSAASEPDLLALARESNSPEGIKKRASAQIKIIRETRIGHAFSSVVQLAGATAILAVSGGTLGIILASLFGIGAFNSATKVAAVSKTLTRWKSVLGGDQASLLKKVEESEEDTAYGVESVSVLNKLMSQGRNIQPVGESLDGEAVIDQARTSKGTAPEAPATTSGPEIADTPKATSREPAPATTPEAAPEVKEETPPSDTPSSGRHNKM